MIELADSPRIDRFLDELDRRVIPEVEPDRERPPGRDRGIDDPAAAFDGVGERLLDEQVAAASERTEARLFVYVRRRRDDHRIHLRVEELPEARERSRAGTGDRTLS